ncbi:MAG: acyltransferase family protein, partial [Janthinobacterium lividum]
MKSSRIYGLDIWRVALLLFGPLVHSGGMTQMLTEYKGSFFEDLTYGSHQFRMPVFFLISGFLSAHARAKRGNWLPRRLQQLAIPVIFTWLFLLTPARAYANAHNYSWNYREPGHLWFLLVLIAVTFALEIVERRPSSIDRLLVRAHPAPSFAIWCAVCIGAVALETFFAAVLRQSPIYLIFTSAPTCMAAYIAGYFLERSPSLATAVKTSRVYLLGPLFVAAAVAAFHYGRINSDHTINMLFIQCCLSGVATATISISLIYSAVRIHR